LTVESPRPEPVVSKPVQKSSALNTRPEPEMAPDLSRIPPAVPVPTPVTSDQKPLSLLDHLKQKQQQDQANRRAKEIRQPVMEELRTIWDRYAGLLKEQQKHSTVTSFQLANLSVEGDIIHIGCQSSLNQKFIEGEISILLQELKAHFHNNNIKVKFMVMEEDSSPKVLEPKYLNSVERFRMMAEEFPLVRELKDKLKLELKY
jgi:DNA polymerase-3 subunit gamma/tau